jgi:hypothetical protein
MVRAGLSVNDVIAWATDDIDAAGAGIDLDLIVVLSGIYPIVTICGSDKIIAR